MTSTPTADSNWTVSLRCFYSHAAKSVMIAQWDSSLSVLPVARVQFPATVEYFKGFFPGWSHSANPCWASVAENGSISPQRHHTTCGQRGGRPKFNHGQALADSKKNSHAASGPPQIRRSKRTPDSPKKFDYKNLVRSASDAPSDVRAFASQTQNESDLPRMSDSSNNRTVCSEIT